jgi:hypothetical protein
MDKVGIQYMWKGELSEMTDQQLSDELDISLKSVDYFGQLLEIGEAGDVVDEHVVDILHHKNFYWSMRRDSCRLAMKERKQATNSQSAAAPH